MEQEKIKIVKTRNIDTRQPGFDPDSVNEEDVARETLLHRKAVMDTMGFIADKINGQASQHDYTKLGGYLSSYTKALKTLGQETFTDGTWWKTHILLERHHLNSRVPDDVNLIDVIEMLCDCIVAGKARSGEYNPISFNDPELLQKAFKNTESLLLSLIEVVDNKEE